jgi:hypothetical protein
MIATAVCGLGVIGWNLAGEIQAANAAIAPGKFLRSLLPVPPDWVDRKTGRQRSMFIGQSLGNSYWFWTLEFWNQSLEYIWSVDDSAPPPGQSTTPNFTSTDGTVDPQVPVRWVLSQPSIVFNDPIAETAGGLNLYRARHPIRIVSYPLGVTPDGWMLDRTSFLRFARHPVEGTLNVSLSRSAACGDVPTSHFTFRIYNLTLDKSAQPVNGKLQSIRHAAIRSTPCEQKTFTFPARAPFKVDAIASPTFLAGDGRRLSAQISYSFTPRR